MKNCIIKSFPGIGTIKYKIASSRDELEQAYALVYREYAMRGFILPKYYKSGLRITLHNALPGTVTFIGLKGKEVVSACTLIPDSPLDLPMDLEYKDEVDKLRDKKKRLCEIGQFALKTDLLGHGLFSMFNFKKLDFMFTLFKLVLQYALFYKGYDELCIVTNPKYMIFRFLPFKVMGDVKYYGYDRIAVKKRAAVAKHLSLKTVEEELKKKIGLFKAFLGSRISNEMYEERSRLQPKDLHYFFVEKSDCFERAKESELDYIRSRYGMTKEEFGRLLVGRSALISLPAGR